MLADRFANGEHTLAPILEYLLEQMAMFEVKPILLRMVPDICFTKFDSMNDDLLDFQNQIANFLRVKMQ